MQVELPDRQRWKTRVELANTTSTTSRSSITGNDATAVSACRPPIEFEKTFTVT
jgi:hypothetical protein